MRKPVATVADPFSDLRRQETHIRAGGGDAASKRQHDKNRLTARERIALLIDPKTELFELGLWAAWNMYQDWGGAPAPASSRASPGSRAARSW